MSNQKININLSRLWENPDERFTLRFRDINKQYKNLLAKRVKEASHLATTRNIEKGPSIEEIYEIIQEINPIIFSESTGSWFGDHTQYRRFGKLNSRSLHSNNFKNLCQIIYKLTSRKKELERNDIRKIMHLTSSNYDLIANMLENRNTPEIQEERLNSEEVGLEDITRARRNLPEGGNGTYAENENSFRRQLTRFREYAIRNAARRGSIFTGLTTRRTEEDRQQGNDIITTTIDEIVQP